MKRWLIILLPIILVAGGLWLVACQPSPTQTGTLRGSVSIGPIFPVERPGETRPVPPEVFSSRKVMVYDESGKKLVKEVSISQTGQTAKGSYSVELPVGTYTVDIPRQGIGGARNLPQKVSVTAGGTVTVDIDIDTGIR